jgi:hypothetical protein
MQIEIEIRLEMTPKTRKMNENAANSLCAKMMLSDIFFIIETSKK